MDRNLLSLWNSFQSGNVKIKDLAEFFNLSTKQTVRYLNKWMEDGWLVFTSGKGRGNMSKLQWLKNVEEIYEKQVMEILDKQQVEKSSSYLLYEWSPNSKLRLMNKFYSKFGYINTLNDKLIIPRRKPFLTVHPLEAIDVESAYIVANVYNRLVNIDEQGNIFPELAHSWDITATRLRLYLRKSIKFHDGSILTAADIKRCLCSIQEQRRYKELWKPISRIDDVSPLVIDIHYPDGCSYCLQLLGLINSSIYKENNSQIIGTGGFYIGENNQEKTELIAFDDYFQERPLLDVVEFIQVPSGLDTIYRSSKKYEGDSIFHVERNYGVGVVIINAWRDSIIQKKEVRDYLHYIIAQNRNTLSEFDCRKIPNHKGCLKNADYQTRMQKIERPKFEAPIIIKATQYTEKTTRWLVSIFERENIPFLIKWVSFEQYLKDKRLNEQVDLYIYGEVFEINEDMSFYHFLTSSTSPLNKIIKKNKIFKSYLDRYVYTDFIEWKNLNIAFEKELIESSVLIPLYYDKRRIPFSSDLMNVEMKHFGDLDFSKLWVRPLI
ncbi:ABC transporter substrate-binding protein [Bacillus pretiosus]|uniref:ABC transporter substrate-binding protein n=1 Tax=Bacillus pretiosus TaxID=2983392 RepID=UPI003D65733A